MQHEPIPVLKIEENATKNYVPTYVSPNWQSHSPPPCLEKAQFYDESFDIEPNTDNIAEQRFYSFYSNSNDKQYSSFDSACQPKIITTPNNRVNDIIDNVPKINNLEQYNPLMVQRQSFSSDEYGFYPEIEPASQQDYLSPINYDYNFSAMPGNFGYGTNSFDMAYHAPQYTQQLVPKLQPTVSMIPQNYNTMTDINNTFPHQDLYANKNQYYAQDQTYYVEKNTAFIDTNQWVGKPNINSQHYYYNNQQF